jgi:hypothetical protein
MSLDHILTAVFTQAQAEIDGLEYGDNLPVKFLVDKIVKSTKIDYLDVDLAVRLFLRNTKDGAMKSGAGGGFVKGANRRIPKPKKTKDLVKDADPLEDLDF